MHSSSPITDPWFRLVAGTVVLVFFSMATAMFAPILLMAGPPGCAPGDSACARQSTEAYLLLGTVGPWFFTAVAAALAFRWRSPSWLVLGYVGVGAVWMWLL